MDEKNSAVKKTLPPISTLFTDSFTLLRSVLAPFIVFNIFIFIGSLVAFILIFAGIILLGISFTDTGLFTQGVIPAVGVGIITIFIITFLLVAVISSLGQIGSVIILYEANSHISPFSVIKRSAKYIIPFIVIGIITGLLILGGFFLLIVPGIILALFFHFSAIAVITEGRGIKYALTRSMFLVQKNFGPFFIRILTLWGIIIILNILISFIGNSGNSEYLLLTTIINIVMQLLASWYSIAYTIVLFKQLQHVTPKGESSLKIPTIVGIVGLVIALLAGYFIVSAIVDIFEVSLENTPTPEYAPTEREELENIFREIQDGELTEEELRQYIPSEEDTSSSPTQTATPPAEATEL